jgi:hypothetical protein
VPVCGSAVDPSDGHRCGRQGPRSSGQVEEPRTRKRPGWNAVHPSRRTDPNRQGVSTGFATPFKIDRGAPGSIMRAGCRAITAMHRIARTGPAPYGVAPFGSEP